MGFFKKMFEKKECAICGGEIGLLGNRKLEDGNMCKHCAAKLSPWFEDRRSSTVAQIQEQLAYREANREKVAAFHVTRTMGDNTKVLLDEDAGVFVVSSERDLAEENPDVLAFSDVTGCDLEIDEDESEIKRQDKEGRMVSYNPPRYRYSYDFYITINVRNPYFDEMRFQLNNFSVDIEPPARPLMGIGRVGSRFDPESDADYRRYREMGEEIKAELLRVRQQVRENAAAAAAPKSALTCPFCGATTTPDASGRCEYCGGAVNG